MIESRAATIGLSHTGLSQSTIEEATARISSRLNPAHAACACIAERMIADDDSSDVVNWLHSLQLPMDHVVSVLWLAEKDGITMRLSDFVEHFDDLWFPGADDLWVFESPHEWVLEFTHEEEVRLWQ